MYRPTPPARRRQARANRSDDGLAAIAFISPAMALFAVFVIAPALAALALSFFTWDLFGPVQFAGLDNILRLFGDDRMWRSLGVTLLYLVLGVAPVTLLGFLLATLLNTQIRGVGALRILYFAPMVASIAVVSVIWATMYHPRSGVLNQLLALVGIQGPNWLNDPFWALPALVVVMIWAALPLVVILYLAGLQRVPDDIYAAASLDGAGRWRQLWSMTWPNVRSTTLLVLALQGVGFVAGSIEIALLMTGGGPLDSTQSLALYAYKVAFERRDIGYASALTLFQLVLLAAVVIAARVIAARGNRPAARVTGGDR